MEPFDLSTTFVALDDTGAARPFEVTRSFWTREAGSERIAGVFEFRSAPDLHPSMQEVHPEADELIFVVSGAIDVVLEERGVERTVALDAGRAAVVPRGVWHRLVMRRPGRLLFINSRAGMQSRSTERRDEL